MFAAGIASRIRSWKCLSPSRGSEYSGAVETRAESLLHAVGEIVVLVLDQRVDAYVQLPYQRVAPAAGSGGR